MKKQIKIIILFVFLLQTSYSFSNSPKSEILDHAYKIVNIEPNTAIEIANIHINNVISKEEKFNCYIILIKGYRNIGLYDQSFKYAFEAGQKIENMTPEQEFYLALEKSDLLRIIDLVEYSNIFINQAKLINKENKQIDSNTELMVKFYMEKFVLEIEQNKFFDAKNSYEILKKNYSNYLQSNLNLDQIINTNYVNILVREGKLNDAEDLIESVLQKYEQNSFEVHPFFYSLAYRKLANIQIQLNNFSQAELTLNKAINLMLPYNNSKVLYDLYSSLANIYLASNDLVRYQEIYDKTKHYNYILNGVETDCHHVIYNMIQENSIIKISKEKIKNDKIYLNILLISVFIILVLILLLIKFIAKYNYKIQLQKYIEYNKKLQENEVLFIPDTRAEDSLENLVKEEEVSSITISDPEENISEVVLNSEQEVIKPIAKVSIMSKELEDELLVRLKKFEKTNKFLSKDISLGLLASYIDTNTKYLSELIKMHYNCNYNAYINNLRINYVITKLRNDPKYMTYKISYLAEISGFSSHSSFATVFKQITGNTPAVFIDFLKKELANEDKL